MYPGNAPRTYVINYVKSNGTVTTDETAIAPESEYFSKIVVGQSTLTTNNFVSVKSPSIYKYLSSNNAGATGYINPSTGVAFTSANNPAGYYKALPTTFVDIPTPGEYDPEIYGRFTEVKGSSTNQNETLIIVCINEC